MHAADTALGPGVVRLGASFFGRSGYHTYMTWPVRGRRRQISISPLGERGNRVYDVVLTELRVSWLRLVRLQSLDGLTGAEGEILPPAAN